MENREQLHTTQRGAERIRRNLQLDTKDVVQWCRAQMMLPDAVVERKGKNCYITTERCKITIHAHSHTIITAHPVKK